MKQKFFETADLYLSSAICILLKIRPAFRVEHGKTLFIFPINDDLYSAMNAFNAGAQINALEFSQMVKRLRVQMLLMRDLEEKK